MSELDVTRARLRRYLLPESADLDEDDGTHFPRSKVMRFALNPRNRRLLTVSGSVIALLASRAVGAGRVGMVANVIRSFARKKR
jgi:hypothetical protein